MNRFIVWRPALMLTLFLVASRPLPARAQLVRTVLGEGTVVRVHLRSGDREQGKLLAPFAPDSTALRFCSYPAPPCAVGGDRYHERLARDIEQLDIHQGTRAGLGALVALPAGFLLGILFADFAEAVGERPVNEAGIVIVSSGVFAGIGALIGGLFHRWEPAM